MNFYIVVEGRRTEQKVFASWIPHLNAGLTRVGLPGELRANNFVIVSGYGFPHYLKTVRNAAIDVTKNPHFGQLVVSVDAEDKDSGAVGNMITAEVSAVNANLHPVVVVQNACIESWFLGNRRVLRKFPRLPGARAWKAFYDVWANCPESMPAQNSAGLNRAQTAFAYFVEGLRDRGAHLVYSKNRPQFAASPTYLDQLRERVADTGHLRSFNEFVGIF